MNRIEILEDLVAIFERLKFSVRRNLNWRLVRSLASLKLLTKASYIMLLIVPFLAAMWPGVRATVNQYNKMAKSSNAIVLKAKADLDSAQVLVEAKIEELKSMTKASPDFTNEMIRRADARNREIKVMLEEHRDEFLQKTFDQPKLPKILAMAFFAALSIGLGHLCYELTAPEQIKNRSFEEFISYKKKDYDTHPTDESMDRAKDYIASRSGKRYSETESKLSYFPMRQMERALANNEPPDSIISAMSTNEFKMYLEELKRHPELEDEFSLLSSAMNDRKSDILGHDNTSESSRLRNLSLIERGARIEYLSLASKNVFFIVLVGLLYMLGIFLIFKIVYKQSQSIIDVSGLNSVFDVFR